MQIRQRIANISPPVREKHTMKLRPYHNPENVDESDVPEGMRFRYADEFPLPALDAKWREFIGYSWEPSVSRGTLQNITYIVPVTP